MLRFSESVKTVELRRTSIPKNDVTVPKGMLITSKGQFQQLFSNKIVLKYAREIKQGWGAGAPGAA